MLLKGNEVPKRSFLVPYEGKQKGMRKDKFLPLHVHFSNVSSVCFLVFSGTFG
jgi:hypothetical protein